MSDPLLSAGRRLQKYELLEEVGHGGMAVVFRGRDTQLNREVAVKVLHPHMAKEQEAKERFQREAQAVARLRHENIIEIYDYSGTDSAESFIVTEFIHGQTLKQFVAAHPVSHPELAALIVIEICAALAHAHGLSVIHRDIKPENIMIRRDGRVKLTDFGIAQMVELAKLTVTGQLIGSPAYMSPELVTGGRVDYRSDVFSVGTLLYQLATAQLPFAGSNAQEVLRRIAEGHFPPPEAANPRVDAQLGAILRHALARDPEARYPSVVALADDLRAFVRAVGLEDVQAELTAYFADPEGFSTKLPQRIVPALLTHARRHLQQGQHARALQQLDRLLSADPEHREALALIARLSARRRWLRTGAVLVGILGLGGLAYAVLAQRAPDPPQPAARTVADRSPGPRTARPRAPERQRAASATAPASAPAATPAGSVGRGSAAPAAQVGAWTAGQAPAPAPDARPALLTTHPRRPALGQPSPGRTLRRVEIVPTPKAITIWVDGREIGPYGPDLRYLDLPFTPVTLTFRNEACCFEQTIQLDAHWRGQPLRVRLPWKPARVIVSLEPLPPGATVVIGAVAARPGQAIEVPIPSYADDGRTQVQVTTSADGYLTEQRTVTVRANTTSEVTMTPRPL
ncbi:MAG: protein kinase [Proteobacteria bacterium]|nr:protein kinase [Pseudomonadota bacterium]